MRASRHTLAVAWVEQPDAERAKLLRARSGTQKRHSVFHNNGRKKSLLNTSGLSAYSDPSAATEKSSRRRGGGLFALTRSTSRTQLGRSQKVAVQKTSVFIEVTTS